MLDWLESPQLRQRCHARLNKSEQRHVLARVVRAGSANSDRGIGGVSA
jgi:TnpA family transposase